MAKGKKNPKCPECGETFDNVRALGSHRHYKHGVMGSRLHPTASPSRAARDGGHTTELMSELVKELKRLVQVEEEYKRLLDVLAETSKAGTKRTRARSARRS